MMMIVSISPHLERKLHVQADNMPNYFVKPNGLKIWEMSHIVELNKNPNHIQAVNGPSNKVYVVLYEEDRHHFDEKSHA